jgi:glycerol-3-phosphate O-acyltransferase
VYLIGPDQQLAAAYYRNTVIHFFVNPAIAELALLRAAEPGLEDRLAAFWSAAMQLRDLLKFEFFFAEKEHFRGELRQVLADLDTDWEATLRAGPEAIQALVRRFRPYNAHRVLRPYLDAYRIVADHLERQGAQPVTEEGRFVSECMGLGQQYQLQRRIRSAASVSQVLFRTALRLAENRGLLRTREPELYRWRAVFADEIRSALKRTEAIGRSPPVRHHHLEQRDRRGERAHQPAPRRTAPPIHAPGGAEHLGEGVRAA